MHAINFNLMLTKIEIMEIAEPDYIGESFDILILGRDGKTSLGNRKWVARDHFLDAYSRMQRERTDLNGTRMQKSCPTLASAGKLSGWDYPRLPAIGNPHAIMQTLPLRSCVAAEFELEPVLTLSATWG